MSVTHADSGQINSNVSKYKYIADFTHPMWMNHKKHKLEVVISKTHKVPRKYWSPMNRVFSHLEVKLPNISQGKKQRFEH